MNRGGKKRECAGEQGAGPVWGSNVHLYFAVGTISLLILGGVTAAPFWDGEPQGNIPEYVHVAYGNKRILLSKELNNPILVNGAAFKVQNGMKGGDAVGVYQGFAYVVYADASTPADVYCAKIDIDSGTIIQNTYVGTTNTTLAQGHVNPSLVVDGNGFIHIVWTGIHPHPVYYRRSSMPANITKFDAVETVAVKGCYSSLQLFEDRLVVLFRPGGHTDGWSIATKKTGEAEWTINKIIANGDPHAYPYDYTIDSRGVFHISWCVKWDSLFYSDRIYYACSSDWGLTWYGANGTELPSPMPVCGGDLVANEMGTFMINGSWDYRLYNSICTDIAGKPTIAFQNTVGVYKQLCVAEFAAKRDQWIVTEVVCFNEDVSYIEIERGFEDTLFCTVARKARGTSLLNYSTDFSLCYRDSRGNWYYQNFEDNDFWEGRVLDIKYHSNEQIYSFVWSRARTPYSDLAAEPSELYVCFRAPSEFSLPAPPSSHRLSAPPRVPTIPHIGHTFDRFVYSPPNSTYLFEKR